MVRWAQPSRSREQIVLFAPTLDANIPDDHPVRLFDELLKALDFKEWEREYFLLDGQPPIHPRILAAVILYGLTLGIRASRKLEYACGNHLDFMWLTEGRVIDHTTLAKFRTRFETPLKGLFRQTGRVAIGMGMANLNQVALDGTVKRASNSRSAVARRATLEQKLSALDERVEALMKEAADADKKDDELFGESSPASLPKELKDLKARQKQLAAALKKVREIEAKQQARGRGSEKGPVVPVTDPDSSLMKNKTGGFAPNHLVVLATEGQSGLIVDYQVPGHDDEPSTVMTAISNLKEAYGSTDSASPAVAAASNDPAPAPCGPAPCASAPCASVDPINPTLVKELLADSNFNTGANLDALNKAGITAFMPAKPAGILEEKPNPAESAEPDAGLGLPINARTKSLDRSAFTFDPQANVYHCPGGRSLPLLENKAERRDGKTLSYSVYQSTSCQGCSLASRCLSGKNTRRTLRRDQHEPLREQMALRMHSDKGRATYKRRSFLAETPFAVINTTMNLRQLLLRGLPKVAIEIGWTCSAYNLKKMARRLALQRPQPALAGL
jgi:transposase